MISIKMKIVALSLEIQVVAIPHTLKVPKEKYNGITNPINHVACFESTLDLTMQLTLLNARCSRPF